MAEILCLRSCRFAKHCGMTLEDSLAYAHVFLTMGKCRTLIREHLI
jgi:hypothetical protein